MNLQGISERLVLVRNEAVGAHRNRNGISGRSVPPYTSRAVSPCDRATEETTVLIGGSQDVRARLEAPHQPPLPADLAGEPPGSRNQIIGGQALQARDSGASEHILKGFAAP